MMNGPSTQETRVPTTATAPTKSVQKKAGLAFWMQRVLAECDKVSADFAPNPVHDLRVALRRCHSMADGLMAIDPDKSWKQMKRAGKPLFQSLGNLREVQVMREWMERLSALDDPAARSLQAFITSREGELKNDALSALQNFDRKRWASWCNSLPRRAARLRLSSAVFKHMALERWTEARELQRQALRNRSQTAFHQLRIGLKRLRYTVENFLPQLHEAWSEEFKEVQDLLGELNDLDLLWATACDIKAFPDEESRLRWRARISQERAERVEKYRQRMLGRHSLWNIWRSDLPHGKQIQSAALRRLKIWASILDPDFQHSQHVADLALQLYDALAGETLITDQFQARVHTVNWRAILISAALMHDVGRSRQEKGHHKISARLIRRLTPPLGLSEQDLQLAAHVARYHCGALPHSRRKAFPILPVEQQPKAVQLAAILRLANAFDAARDGHISRLQAQTKNGMLNIYAQGYSPFGRVAENVAAARHLLELALRRPIIVRRLVNSRSSVKKAKPSALRKQRVNS